MGEPDVVRVGLVQARSPATPAAALDHLVPLVRKAAAAGAQFILTPEASNMMQRHRDARDLHLADEASDPVVTGLAALAAELGILLLIGSAMVRTGRDDDDRAANRSLLISPSGKTIARYDKLHVFDVDLPGGESYRESATVRPGEAAAVVDTPFGRLGLSICYDLRFPQLFRALARAGAGIITVPAAFTVTTGRAHWETLLRARAIETGAFVLAPAQGGAHEDGRATWGHSLVIDPWGEVVARRDDDATGILLADLSMSAVGQARAAIPSLRHDRDFQLPQ
ncbi:MAG: carbon-nitrogen hydrolase family protein [Brevundimonas sp.]|uniref:carbon-nitrogen hydrolase family protein n=1 Tax=Brevundimonas sp. TaxID=1871086 RepID=UPI0022BFCD0D|nr:carbon-nitrogen hydrolase family protein [Brevundimonas sp.]